MGLYAFWFLKGVFGIVYSRSVFERGLWHSLLLGRFVLNKF